MSDCNGSLELGIVVGPTKPDQITFEASRPVSLGEYVRILSSQQKKILGVIESSSIKSDALSDNISNFQEAMESKQIASKNKRDKSYKANVKILGLLEELKKCKTILLEIPPLPCTEVFNNDYKGLRIRNANLIPAKINPRLLSADKFADVIEIRDIADIQKTILSKVFDDDLKKRTGDDFWQTLEENIKNVEQIEKRNKSSAERVRDKVKEAHRRLSNILHADAADPVAMIKEGKSNIISLLELNEKQANIAISFYLESILSDRKNAKNQLYSEGSGFVRFKSPIIVVIEEAHVFIPKQEYTDTKYFAAKVAREGRKFGVGLVVVSQRPRSIDSNVLSQLGSLAIMKVVQQEDQTQIASTSESLTTKLTEQLPSLNPGEALLIGQWVNLPSFAKMDEAKDRWMGTDPDPVAEWKSNRFHEEMARESSQSYIRE